jgi:hypothetical protein
VRELIEPAGTFLFFSAHRFFIISDNRFLPAGVRWSRFCLLRVARCGTALLFAVAFGDWPPHESGTRDERYLRQEWPHPWRTHRHGDDVTDYVVQ